MERLEGGTVAKTVTETPRRYIKLGATRQVKYPFNCRPDSFVIVEELHKVDPKFTKREEFEGKKMQLKISGQPNVMVRTEVKREGQRQRSFAAVALMDLEQSIIYSFSAVKFRLWKDKFDG